jgi:hypothetical protein
MQAIEQLNAHAYLYLTELAEPADNLLRLVVTEGRVRDAEGVRVRQAAKLLGPFASETLPIIADELSASYEILFEQYIAYSVLNESFTVWDDSEKFRGKLFRTYSESKFLTFVHAATIASDEYPGPYTHYGVVCLNHIVEVASTLPPRIRQIGLPE